MATYTQIIKAHACNWIDLTADEIAGTVGCPRDTAKGILNKLKIEYIRRPVKWRAISGIDTARYDCEMLSQKTGLSRAYISQRLRRSGLPFKSIRGHIFLTGRKSDLCEAYAEKLNRSFMSITQCYWNEKSATALGKVWGLTDKTIMLWVKQEQGMMRPRGGYRHGKKGG